MCQSPGRGQHIQPSKQSGSQGGHLFCRVIGVDLSGRSISVQIPSQLHYTGTMRLQILLHPQLRTTLPECAQRSLRRNVWVRFKSQIPRPSQKHLSPLPKSKETIPATRSPVTRNLTPPKTTTRAGNANPPHWYQAHLLS